MITLEKARAMQAEAQEKQYGRKCPSCKLFPFYLGSGVAVIEGHVYSEAGRSELGLSGMCEFCFDRMEPDEDREERTGGVVDPDIPRELPLEGMVLQMVTDLDDYDAESGRYDTTDAELAQVTTSLVEESYLKPVSLRKHKVVLDIDLPAKLIPSSTEGHFHLYIDHEVPHRQYMDLLTALANAGIIEEGYASASQERGFTAARLPWVKKPSSEVDEFVEVLLAAIPDPKPGDPF